MLLYKGLFTPFGSSVIMAGMLLSAVSSVHGQGKPQDLTQMSLAARGATPFFCVAEFISEIAMIPRPSES